MNNTQRLLLVLAGVLVVAGGVYAYALPAPSPSSAPVAGAGEHCGGFIKDAPVCSSGYHCELKVSMPDTGGTCVADATGVQPHDSGIRGTVSLGPTCPVERDPPDPQCADKPYATKLSITRSGSSSAFATAQSASDGTFSIPVPPGSYTVSAQSGTMLPRCAPVSVSVTSTQYAVADISCDTGIR